MFNSANLLYYEKIRYEKFRNVGNFIPFFTSICSQKSKGHIFDVYNLLVYSVLQKARTRAKCLVVLSNCAKFATF